MVYSFSKCPSCHKVINTQTNPVHTIDIPFEQCPFCGVRYLNPYKEEWITKSPTKRFFFFLTGGVWARAIVVPILLVTIISLVGDVEGIFFVAPILSIIWLIVGYLLRKNLLNDDIRESLIRTNNPEYLKSLKVAGYSIYPIDESVPQNNRNNINSNLSSKNNANNQTYQTTERNSICFCRKCGNKIVENSKFCNACGSKIDWN